MPASGVCWGHRALGVQLTWSSTSPVGIAAVEAALADAGAGAGFAAEAWPRITHDNQAMVEAASIALALFETRDWIWNRLDQATQEQVADYLEAMARHRQGFGNWYLFRVVVLTFLQAVGAREDDGLVSEALAAVDTLYRGDGWYADGGAPGDAQFDYYTG